MSRVINYYSLAHAGIIGRMKQLEDADVESLPTIGIANYGVVYYYAYMHAIFQKVGVLENIGD